MPRKFHPPFEVTREDPDLIPIMSIMVILVPMLVFMFSFVEITVQAVAAPKMGTGQSKPTQEDQKRPVNLTVLISDKGFVIKYDEEMMTQEEKPIPLRTFPPDVEHREDWTDYDWPGLHNRLEEMKKKFPEEQTLNIGAEFHIPWKVIARTIDTARLKLVGGPFETMEAYQTGKAACGKYKGPERKVCLEPEYLFPNVVFVVAE